jgi:hypothetical protein
MTAAKKSPNPVQLAPGLVARQLPDGTTYIEPSGERKTQTVAFRVAPSTYVTLLAPLVDTFPDHQISTAFRWLLEQPAVLDAIRGKISEATVHV